MKINSHRLKVEYSDKQFSCNNDYDKNMITYHSTTVQYVKFQVKSWRLFLQLGVAIFHNIILI